MNTEWSGHHRDKDQLRAEIWSSLKQNNASIRDPFGHIPNFFGSEMAAKQLTNLPIWQQAKTIFSPDFILRQKIIYSDRTNFYSFNHNRF